MYFQRGNPLEDRNVQRKLDGSVVQFFEKKNRFPGKSESDGLGNGKRTRFPEHGVTIERSHIPFIKSLILAQDERWRRA